MAMGSVLLGVLAEGPAHGYDLKRAHDDRFPGSKKLAYGQVYATLARLERDGLVEVVVTEQDAGPERTVYALTEQGTAELRAWLSATEAPADVAADELVRKTITALHSGVDSGDFLGRQRSAHMEVMRRLARERETTTDLGARLALDHLVLHLDADLRWLEESRAKVTDDTVDTARSTR